MEEKERGSLRDRLTQRERERETDADEWESREREASGETFSERANAISLRLSTYTMCDISENDF